MELIASRSRQVREAGEDGWCYRLQIKEFRLCSWSPEPPGRKYQLFLNPFSILLMNKCKQLLLHRKAADQKSDRSRLFSRQCSWSCVAEHRDDL